MSQTLAMSCPCQMTHAEDAVYSSINFPLPPIVIKPPLMPASRWSSLDIDHVDVDRLIQTAAATAAAVTADHGDPSLSEDSEDSESSWRPRDDGHLICINPKLPVPVPAVCFNVTKHYVKSQLVPVLQRPGPLPTPSFDQYIQLHDIAVKLFGGNASFPLSMLVDLGLLAFAPADAHDGGDEVTLTADLKDAAAQYRTDMLDGDVADAGDQPTRGHSHSTGSQLMPAIQQLVQHLNSTHPAFHKFFDRVYSSESEAVEHAVKHPMSTWAVLAFRRLDTVAGVMDVTIRMNYSYVPKTAVLGNMLSIDTDSTYVKYVISGFLSLQQMVAQYMLHYAPSTASAPASGARASPSPLVINAESFDRPDHSSATRQSSSESKRADPLPIPPAYTFDTLSMPFPQYHRSGKRIHASDQS